MVTGTGKANSSTTSMRVLPFMASRRSVTRLRMSGSRSAIMCGHSGGPKCRFIRRRLTSCSGGSSVMIVASKGLTGTFAAGALSWCPR